jgi:hypothetical protein
MDFVYFWPSGFDHVACLSGYNILAYIRVEILQVNETAGGNGPIYSLHLIGV